MTRLEILEKALKDPCKRATQVEWRSGGYLYSGCESPIRAKERKLQKHPHKRPCKHGENIYPQSIKYSVQLITNPATSTFIWVGTVNTEVIFLNDFRWNPKIIQWHVCCYLKESFLSQTVTWERNLSSTQICRFSARQSMTWCTSKEGSLMRGKQKWRQCSGILSTLGDKFCRMNNLQFHHVHMLCQIHS